MAQGLGGVLGHPGGHAVCHNVGHQGCHCGQDHHAAPEEDQAHIPLGDHVIDHVGEDPGQKQFHHSSDKLDEDAQAHPWDEGFDVVQDHMHGCSSFRADGLQRAVVFILLSELYHITN